MEEVTVPGLPPDYPALRCNADDVCLLTTGMGHANAAASTLAVTLDPALRPAPAPGSWSPASPASTRRGARPAARPGPAGWSTSASPTRSTRARCQGWKHGLPRHPDQGPGEKPKLEYRTEVARLDEALLQKALALSRGATLADSAEAQRLPRPLSRAAPAQPAPAGDPVRHARRRHLVARTRLGQHAREWTRLLTDGQGTYCTTQQEDNATYNALERAAAAGRVDLKRLAVLRTGSQLRSPVSGPERARLAAGLDNGGTGRLRAGDAEPPDCRRHRRAATSSRAGSSGSTACRRPVAEPLLASLHPTNRKKLHVP